MDTDAEGPDAGKPDNELPAASNHPHVNPQGRAAIVDALYRFGAGQDLRDRINVEVTRPSPATFDALYGFGKGGVFVRIDGRNNAPAVRTWKRTEDGAIVFSNILFNFVNGVRTGLITGKFIARVDDGAMTGSFTAEGHDIPGFLKELASSPEPASRPKPLRDCVSQISRTEHGVGQGILGVGARLANQEQNETQ